jgi:multidrug resistance efflux pump
MLTVQYDRLAQANAELQAKEHLFEEELVSLRPKIESQGERCLIAVASDCFRLEETYKRLVQISKDHQAKASECQMLTEKYEKAKVEYARYR